jgi:hypothetical protein
MTRTLRYLWSRWKAVAHVIGDFQARLILTVFYAAILAPFALGLKAFADPLQVRHRGRGWSPRLRASERPAGEFQRQF